MEILFYFLSYIIGSISFSYIIVKLYSGEDVREKGSNNAGTTNVIRNYGIWLGVLTYLLDSTKGMLCVILSNKFGYSPVIAACFAVIGHIFPFYMKFRGGKGIATVSGGFTLLFPKYFLTGLMVFLGVLLLTKTVSISSISLIVYLAIISIFVVKLSGWELFFALLTFILILFMHRKNIKRIVRGEESKLTFGGKK